MIFSYRCKNDDGLKEGYIDANSMKEASMKLEKEGLDVLELKEQVSLKGNVLFNYEINVFNLQEKKSFYNSLSEQYSAGITFIELFNNIISTTANNNIRSLCFNMVKKMRRGDAFEDIILYYSKYIGEVYASLIIAGHKTGKLESILKNIASQVKEEEKVISIIKSKTTYPKLVFGLMVFALCAFGFFVFPVFNKIAEGESIALCAMLFFAFVKTAIIFGILGIIIYQFKKSKNLQEKAFSSIFSIKILQEILENYRFYNFFVVLSMAYEAGLSPNDLFTLAKKIICAQENKQKIEKIESMLFNGCNLATAFGVSELFSEYAISQVSTGEKTGGLGKAFEDISQDYKKKYMEKIDALLKIFEPSLIAIAAIFVAVMAAQMFSKYYEMLFSLL